MITVLITVLMAGCSGTKKNDTESSNANESGSGETSGAESLENGATSDESLNQSAEESAEADYILGSGKELRFRSGTYAGEATGYAGPVTVEVTVSEDSIISIDAVYDSESENVGQIAIPKLIDQIIDSNGSNIDVISGATYSSKGLLDAVDDALRQAVEDSEAYR